MRVTRSLARALSGAAEFAILERTYHTVTYPPSVLRPKPPPLGTLARDHRQPDLAAMVLESLGLTLADLKRAGADAYDLAALTAINSRLAEAWHICDTGPATVELGPDLLHKSENSL